MKNIIVPKHFYVLGADFEGFEDYLHLRYDSEDMLLRGMLLTLYCDESLAKHVGDKKCIIYDPVPDLDGSYYLSLDQQDDRIRFLLETGGKAGYDMLCEASPFELRRGRFFLEGRELIDYFPELTASGLEGCIEKFRNR